MIKRQQYVLGKLSDSGVEVDIVVDAKEFDRALKKLLNKRTMPRAEIRGRKKVHGRERPDIDG